MAVWQTELLNGSTTPKDSGLFALMLAVKMFLHTILPLKWKAIEL
ncbi:conserved protein of unknown function [Shewanella benthica]|uniref:Uncharacterized protein n=1 Tax=Shewanella benthica TaxID=43661 RepID=A0A330M194_9GAMM|nr:conserved protein of unknown function [Shewanella benthica]